MPTKDPGIDAYIKMAAPFARPILTHLRKIVHEGCPNVVETLKWGAPFFEYRGVFCGMAAFKAHAIFGFWKGQILHNLGLPETEAKSAVRFGRITTLADLPSDRTLLRLVRAAAKLNDDGVKVARPKAAKKPPVKVSPFIMAALRKNKIALANFEGLSPSHKREYIEWVTQAKAKATRDRRIATMVEWLVKGKSRNWKYERR